MVFEHFFNFSDVTNCCDRRSKRKRLLIPILNHQDCEVEMTK